jgi:hypothetical protein
MPPLFAVRCWRSYYSVYTLARHAVRHLIHAHFGVHRRLAHKMAHAAIGGFAVTSLLTCVLVPVWAAYRALPPVMGWTTPGPVGNLGGYGQQPYLVGYGSPEILPTAKCEHDRHHEHRCKGQPVSVPEPSSLVLLLGPLVALALIKRT